MTKIDRAQAHVNLWMTHNAKIHDAAMEALQWTGGDLTHAAAHLKEMIDGGLINPCCAVDLSLFTAERIRIAFDYLETHHG